MFLLFELSFVCFSGFGQVKPSQLESHNTDPVYHYLRLQEVRKVNNVIRSASLTGSHQSLAPLIS